MRRALAACHSYPSRDPYVLLTTTSNSGEATANLNLALRLATVGARRGACLRSSC